MSALPAFRAAIIVGGMLAAASYALAQEAAPPPTSQPPQVDFRDLGATGGLSISARTNDARFAPAEPGTTDMPASRPMELQIAAGREQTGAPVDVSIAHRRLIGSSDDERQGQGSELRVGRGLVAQDNGRPRQDSVYAFVASDDQALTWRPGARSEFGGAANALVMQDAVNVGDTSAGVTYEHNGVQTSLAYVERTVRTRIGNRGYSQDEAFTGVTVTMRH